MTKDIQERMQDINNALNEYELKAGLVECKSPGTEEELETYLNMGRAVLDKLSIEDCAEIGIRLSQFSFYLKRLSNKEQARIVWAQHELNKIVALHVNDYDKYMKHDVKVLCISRENESARKLCEILRYAEQRIARLTDLAISIKTLSDSVKNLGRSKTDILKSTH